MMLLNIDIDLTY